MTTRRERVIVELEDRFSGNAVKVAASAELIAMQLERVDGRASRAGVAVQQFSSRDMAQMRRNVDQGSASIDRFSGRLGLAARAVGALGPALAPLTTAVVPAIAGLTASLGAAALGMGVVVSAFQGVGDAMDAVSKAKIAPTAANIEKARAALGALPAASRAAVHAMQEWRPLLADIKAGAASGFFPGFVDGLESLERFAPRIERLFHNVGEAAGGLFDDMADSAALDRFIAYLDAEAAPTLTTFGHTIGNVASGIGDLIIAMDPLSDDFADGLLSASERFAEWANELSETNGYREFIAYVRETGPQVMETLGSFADALLQVGEAAAPLGGPVLQVLEAFADTVAAIADSPLGPPLMAAVTAMSALSLATKGFNAAATSAFVTTGAGASVRAGVRSFTRDLEVMAATAATAGARTERELARASDARRRTAVRTGVGGAAVIGGVAAAEAGLIGTNTVMGASLGLIAGPWGAAVGAGVGLMSDLAAASMKAAEAQREFNDALGAGDFDTAQAKLDEMKKELEDYQSGWNFERILDSISGTEGTGEADRMSAVAQAERDYTAALDEEARAHGYASNKAREHAEAIYAVRDAALASINAELGYEQAQLDLAGAVKESGRVLDKNGNALRGHKQAAIDSRRALIGMASAYNSLAKETPQTTDQVVAARKEFIRAAQAMGMGTEEARILARTVIKVGQIKAKPTVKLQGASKARADALGVKAAMDALRDKTVTITLIREAITGARAGGQGQGAGVYTNDFKAALDAKRGHLDLGRANGGTIPGRRHPYGDKVLTYLAPGEEVISNRYGQADRHRMLLKAINANAMADGGTVGGSRAAAEVGGLRELNKAAHESAKALRKELKMREEVLRSQLEDLRGKRSDLVGRVGDRFRSNIFETDGDVWAEGAGDWRAALKQDIGQARQFNATAAVLRRKGLSGTAAADLFANASLQQIQGFAQSATASDVRRLEVQYAMRDRLATNIGRQAGTAAYGPQIAELGRKLDALIKQGKTAPKETGRETGRAVNGAASTASRRSS